MSFSSKMGHWFAENGRSLPWRGQTDPYKIWISEIILQQTRIEQGRDYYLRFVERFPTVAALAAAEEEEVLKCWQGLGYYSRARNLHNAARQIVDSMDGKFPSTHEQLLTLKGVGRYTAAAIASFAFRLPYPVIDGNVYRFISRLYGISTPVPSTAGYNEFEALLLHLIDRDRPDLFNHAIMDFGSTYCKPVGPDCPQCIFADTCVAHRQGTVDLFPVRKAPAATRDRHFYYFDIVYNHHGTRHIVVRQRHADDIWKGLYDLPLLETAEAMEGEQLRREAEGFLRKLGWATPPPFAVAHTALHKLTHQTLHATFLRVEPASTPAALPPDLQAIEEAQLHILPVPRLIDNYLTQRSKAAPDSQSPRLFP